MKDIPAPVKQALREILIALLLAILGLLGYQPGPAIRRF